MLHLFLAAGDEPVNKASIIPCPHRTSLPVCALGVAVDGNRQ